VKTDKNFTILHNGKIFYTIVFIMGTFGIYLANLIEERYKVVASGTLGFVIPYLIYKAFVSPKIELATLLN